MVSVPIVPAWAKRLVLEALVAKVFVLVALVIVAFVPNRLVKVPRVAVRMEEKKLVEVAWVLVLFNSVTFWKVVEAPVKVFDPEKVLLLARRVVDAPVGLPLQPNTPPV